MGDSAPLPRPLLRAGQAIVAAALLFSALNAVAGVGGPAVHRFTADWLHNALMVVAAAAVIVRVVCVRADRGVWICIAGALCAYAVGETTWSLLYAQMESPPYPSVSDVAWLAFYPLSYAALVLLARARIRRFHASLWLDGLIAAFAVAAFAAALLYPTIVDAANGAGATAIISLAYPLGDLILLAIVTAVFGLTAWRPGRQWCFLGLGLAIVAVGDTVYGYQTVQGTWVDGSLWDLLFPLAMLVVAYAAWQPGEARGDVSVDGWRVFVAPAVFSFAAFGLAVYGAIAELNPLAEGLALATLATVMVRTGLTVAEHLRLLERTHHDAITDALTGLGNRRLLADQLPAEVAAATATSPRALVLFDLDGFKRYNDTYGHPAGDALLARLGENLRSVIAPWGSAYRLGGDEFCILIQPGHPDLKTMVAAATGALSEEGDGFTVTASYGVVHLPLETSDPTSALLLADQRMYGHKDSRRASAVSQTRDVLLRVLREREPELHEHLRDVATLAVGVARRMSLEAEQIDEIARAAELHDIGKMAIPDAILSKPGPLDADEWEFMRNHTLIGERILGAAPALRSVAKLVRSSHERWDGDGYPDRLAGTAIPLGARIILVCDAFDAMTTDRAYGGARSLEEAEAELRAGAGTQFDAAVVEAFIAELEGHRAPPSAAVGSVAPGATGSPDVPSIVVRPVPA